MSTPENVCRRSVGLVIAIFHEHAQNEWSEASKTNDIGDRTTQVCRIFALSIERDLLSWHAARSIREVKLNIFFSLQQILLAALRCHNKW